MEKYILDGINAGSNPVLSNEYETDERDVLLISQPEIQTPTPMGRKRKRIDLQDKFEETDLSVSATSRFQENDDKEEELNYSLQKTPTPKAAKRKYTSYRKLDDEDEQNKFDESLVSLVMDKKEISSIKIEASKRTKEKVALAWLEIQQTLKSGEILLRNENVLMRYTNS